jgi:integrase
MSAPLTRTKVPGVYRRGSRYSVVYRDRQGRQHKRSAASFAEARLLKSALTAAVARGEYYPVSRLTLAEYLPEWLSTYAGRTNRGLRAHTRLEYQRDLERHALPFFGRTRLVAIEPRDIKRFIATLIDQGLCGSSVRRRLAPLRALLATAVEDGMIRSNPAAGVRVPRSPADRTDHDRRKALSEEELRRLLRELPAGWRLFVEFLSHTGLRFSEAIGLRWTDVDFEERCLHVRRRLYHGFDAPKSRYGRRAIPLSARMLASLASLRQSTSFRAESDPVFASRTGTPLDYANLYRRVFKPAARRAGVPWASFHTLRHTCATVLFRNGLDAKQVQIWLGHHSPAFTLAVYVHLDVADLPDPEFLDAITARDVAVIGSSSQAQVASVSSAPQTPGLTRGLLPPRG